MVWNRYVKSVFVYIVSIAGVHDVMCLRDHTHCCLQSQMWHYAGAMPSNSSHQAHCLQIKGWKCQRGEVTVGTWIAIRLPAPPPSIDTGFPYIFKFHSEPHQMMSWITHSHGLGPSAANLAIIQEIVVYLWWLLLIRADIISVCQRHRTRQMLSCGAGGGRPLTTCECVWVVTSCDIMWPMY